MLEPGSKAQRRSRAVGVAAALLLAVGSGAALGTGFEPPLPLGELIDVSDAVLVGTITGVSASTFTFRVSEVVRGRIPGPSIEVDKFPAPETSPRWAPYCTGQSVLLFLAAGRASGGGRGPFHILGRIGEGEIPLDERYAYFHSRYVSFLEADHHRIHDRTVYIQRFDRATTIAAISAYPPCLEWREAERAGRRRAKVACSASELAAYRARSPLHEFLVGEAEQSAGGPRS
ncbi:MAG TPA: hypothetical protein VM599_05955 [Thermoanaerobaculia bacterium]|nr:hypothetical protein [Thermoanaerobaculia bacterium]